MQTYCSSCKNHTHNIDPRKVVITNQVVRQTSKCTNCVAEKSGFLKQKSNKKNGWSKLILNFSCTNIIKHVNILF